VPPTEAAAAPTAAAGIDATAAAAGGFICLHLHGSLVIFGVCAVLPLLKQTDIHSIAAAGGSQTGSE
jgi:hypothetical protein